jgi:protein-arginine kinase activator protein McsA
MTTGTLDDRNAATMLCQACKKRDALIHLSLGSSLRKRKHYCRECADRYFARTPGMNSARDLIRLSNFYRSKLYDELEAHHPEAFDNSEPEACRRGSDLMRRFLEKRLTKDGIRLKGDA